MQVEKAERVFQVRGFDRDPIQDLQLLDVTVRNAGTIGVLENVSDLVTDNVTINGKPFAA